MTTATQPAKRFRLGSITLTVWPNQDRNGNTYYSTTITRRYRDGSGNWSDTSSLRHADLPIVRDLVRMGQDWLQLQGTDAAQDAASESDDQPIAEDQYAETKARKRGSR